VWEKAQAADLDRQEWHQNVAQCTYEGRSINKLQNGIIMLIFKI